ncbi:hypothetical protein Hte_010337 [Hypoxylon texense]
MAPKEKKPFARTTKETRSASASAQNAQNAQNSKSAQGARNTQNAQSGKKPRASPKPQTVETGYKRAANEIPESPPPAKKAKNDDAVRNGLDQKLAPIATIDAAFRDMIVREKQLMDPDTTGAAHISVATMCSGTEAPIEALRMITDMQSWVNPGEEHFTFMHKFSVEIEKYKQTYIHRNTNATLFNNMLDFINPKDGKAPTALGSVQEIPGDIDLLVAGTSCVDFSSLNTKRAKEFGKAVPKDKDIQKPGQMDSVDMSKVPQVFEEIIANIDNLGESSQTFFSLLSYVRSYRPKVVIMENVHQAPFATCCEIWFPFVEYFAAHVNLDTKDFYLPQTRTRAWLIALDCRVFGKDKAKAIAKSWVKYLTEILPRRASAPVSAWLLPPAHPLTERARQDDSEKAQTSKADVNWEHSKSRHNRVRKQEELGDECPVTHWRPADNEKPYDRIDQCVLKSLGERVQDCIDIYYLRAKRAYFDLLFKLCMLELSQNVDRSPFPPFGLSGCLTPDGIPWVSNQSRLLSGYETLLLQGLPINRIQFATETQEQLRDLAGNAMSTPVVGSCILAMLSCVKKEVGPLAMVFHPPQKQVQAETRTSIFKPRIQRADFDLYSGSAKSVDEIIAVFEKCRRYCYCNGSARYSTDKFVKCKVCHAIRCEFCKGMPQHDFDHEYTRPEGTVSLNEVEQLVLRQLPSVLHRSFGLKWNVGGADPHFDLKFTIASDDDITNALRETMFTYTSVHVTEVVTICYLSDSVFELRAKLWENGITWYLYLNGWSDMAKKFRKRLGLEPIRLLQQPVARAQLTGSSSPLPENIDNWELRSFQSFEMDADIQQEDAGISIKFTPKGIADDQIGTVFPGLLLDTLFLPRPDCDAPESSLHVSSDLRLFLFKDATEVGPPKRDCYIIADECRQLESHEYRESIIRFEPEVNFLKLAGANKVATPRVDGYWVPTTCDNKLSLHHYGTFRVEQYLRVPAARHQVIHVGSEDQHVLVHGTIMIPMSSDVYGAIVSYKSRSFWVPVKKEHMHHFWDFMTPFNVKLSYVPELEVKVAVIGIRNWLEELNDWKLSFNRLAIYGENGADRHTTKPSFGKLPPHEWIKIGSNYVAYHLPDAIARFETELKEQAPIFEAHIRIRDTTHKSYMVDLQYLINYIALAKKAAAYLPATHDSSAHISVFARVELNAMMTENMKVGTKARNSYSFEPFRNSLKPLGSEKEKLLCGTSAEQKLQSVDDESFGATLGPNQRQSLAWMLSREQDSATFTEREVEEESIPQLKIRLVGSAERNVCNHGGILADDVGYGKTVVTLALLHAQEQFDQNESIHQREEDHSSREQLKATLVLVPSHLVKQWSKEALKFLKIRPEEIVEITKLKDLEVDGNATILHRFRKARLVIVSTTVFADNNYYRNIAKWAGSTDPPFGDSKTKNGARGRPFEEWYESASENAGEFGAQLVHLRHPTEPHKEGVQVEQSLKHLRKKIEERRKELYDIQNLYADDYNQRKRVFRTGGKRGGKRGGKKKNEGTAQIVGRKREFDSEGTMIKGFKILFFEIFSWSRSIFDEFSYTDPATAIFFRHSCAYAKWILSATPPTRSLATVCEIAHLMNVHIARPVHARAGMPRITDGPELENPSDAEQLLAHKFLSDRSIVERHTQAEKFLAFFASANPLDTTLSGNVEVVERVVVCHMNEAEAVKYNDLVHELKPLEFNADSLPVSARRRLTSLMGHEEWGADTHGKHVGAKAAIFRASIIPKSDASKSGKQIVEELITARKIEREKALTHLRRIVDKTIWLVDRVMRNPAEAERDNAINPAKDALAVFSDITQMMYSRFGGYDTWKAIYKVLNEPVRCVLPDDYLDPTFIQTLMWSRADSWIKYFTVGETELRAMSGTEAEELVKDIDQVAKPPATMVSYTQFLLPPVPPAPPQQPSQDAAETENQAAAEEPAIAQGEASAQEETKTKDKKARSQKKKRETPAEKEAREAKEKEAREAREERDNHWRRTLRSRLQELKLWREGSLDEELEDEDSDNDDDDDEDEGDAGQARPSNRRGPTKNQLIERFREQGIIYKNTANVGELRDLWQRHEDKQLKPWDYVGTDSIKPVDFPTLLNEMRIRGGKYTLTRAEVSSTSLALRKGLEKVDKAIKQERVITNITSTEARKSCERCRDVKPVDELWMVGGCGHLLCELHLDDRVCGPPTSQYACPSPLKGDTVPLHKVWQPLNSEGPREAQKFSSKTWSIVGLIHSIPDGEFVVLFSQFRKQIDEIEECLRQSRISVTTEPSGNDGMHKVRILELNHSSSAGTNLQYAHHVIFAAPLLTDLQETYDASMKQARGRCVRHGQENTVQVYHFVTAETIEVDMLELRQDSDILVPVGKTEGKLRKRIKQKENEQDGDGDVQMADAESEQAMVRVNSTLNPNDVWQAMNERDWLTTMGIEH